VQPFQEGSTGDLSPPFAEVDCCDFNGKGETVEKINNP